MMTIAIERPYDTLAARNDVLAGLIALHGRPDPFSWFVLDDAVYGDPFAELVLQRRRPAVGACAGRRGDGPPTLPLRARTGAERSDTMTSTYSQDHHPTLRHPDREAVGTELQRVLVLLLDLQLTGKHAHWNVIGAPFRAVHLELDEFVDAWRDASDLVAERAAALGHPPDGRAGTVSAMTQLPALPEGPLPGGALIDALIPVLTETVGLVRERTDRIEAVDVVTADLLHGVTAMLEKQLWILRAQAG